MMKTRVAVLLPLALAACVTPTARVEAGLERAGLKPHLARCMAPRLADRLSHDQLRQLASLPKAPRARSFDELLYRLRALDDPDIVHVTSKAALKCEIDHALD
ncbi:hypothetical protein [Hephaestia mangrovi]|uniref:hypothetical protein n=1 Tax=Hephaestia mangrovi TaxID=2873268 RepID=UPI001CA77C7B|nr:hypothetical protein [Hephaestia mangrovi]MBY8829116.1 hypothetical protein [Hephaestia mangrovi]